MNLSLTEDQANWRAKAAAFSNGVLRGDAERFETNGELIQTAYAEAGSRGLLDGWLLAGAGGQELDTVTVALICEELACGEGALAVLLANRYLCHRVAALLSPSDFAAKLSEKLSPSNNCADPLLLWPDGATESLETGEATSASMLKVKRHLGIAGARSIAREAAQGLIGFGQADVHGVTSRVAFFLSDGSGREVKAEPLKPLGLGALSASNYSFEKSHEGADSLYVFTTAEAYSRFIGELASTRALLFAATILGIARAAFEYALNYSRERTTFGKPISQHQAVALKLADMGTGLESARLMLWEAAASGGEGRIDAGLAATAWEQCQEVAIETAIPAVQLLGGHGYLKLHPVEKYMRDIQFLRVIAGH